MITIKDPIYNLVEVEDEFVNIINNPFFQRLRSIKQVSMLFYVYPSAKHDRFTHSIGTYHLMKKVVENKRMNLSDKEKFNLKAAALLHDLGHRPYSHLWDLIIDDHDHEAMSAKIITEVFVLPEVADIILRKNKYYPLLSSVIDVDKLDYMARDSYFCGVGYGNTDVERIVNHMYIKDDKLCVSPKIIPSIEHVITGRISLFKSTYYHHSVRSMDTLVTSIFQRAKDLYKEGKEIFIDPLLAKFIKGDYELQDFLLLDDSVIEFHLRKWFNEKDPIMKDLMERFFSRTGFRAINTSLQAVNIEELKESIAKDFDLKYYFYQDIVKKGVYESEVYIEKDDGSLIPLSEYSLYIKKLTEVCILENFVIGPKEKLKKS